MYRCRQPRSTRQVLTNFQPVGIDVKVTGAKFGERSIVGHSADPPGGAEACRGVGLNAGRPEQPVCGTDPTADPDPLHSKSFPQSTITVHRAISDRLFSAFVGGIAGKCGTAASDIRAGGRVNRGRQLFGICDRAMHRLRVVLGMSAYP
jgi:hypothetical protein